MALRCQNSTSEEIRIQITPLPAAGVLGQDDGMLTSCPPCARRTQVTPNGSRRSTRLSWGTRADARRHGIGGGRPGGRVSDLRLVTKGAAAWT